MDPGLGHTCQSTTTIGIQTVKTYLQVPLYFVHFGDNGHIVGQELYPEYNQDLTNIKKIDGTSYALCEQVKINTDFFKYVGPTITKME